MDRGNRLRSWISYASQASIIAVSGISAALRFRRQTIVCDSIQTTYLVGISTEYFGSIRDG